jgi:hypothetical protein
MASLFDRFLMSTLTRKWDPATISSYTERVRQHEESMPAEVSETFQSLDSKAAGLLTHVSMMIAGLGLIAPMVVTHELETAVIVFQIGVYLLIAIGCLRCLTVFSPRELSVGNEDRMQRIGQELLLRRELYGLCSRAAILFTVVVFITLPLLYAW